MAEGSSSMRTFIILAVITLFGIATFALSAATLSAVNKKYNDLKNIVYSQITTRPPLNAVLAESLPIQDVMLHLREFQRIATMNNDTRAIHTPGFNQTVNYIESALKSNTDFIVNRTSFPVRQYSLLSNPTFTVNNNSGKFSYNYSTNLSITQFYQVRYSVPVNISTPTRVAVVRGFGCSRADWENSTPPANGLVALVKRGDCTFAEKAKAAVGQNVTAILFYNDGLSPDRIPPIEISLGQENTIPALFLSFTLGQSLSNASQNFLTGNSVEMFTNEAIPTNASVWNVCADTPTGNVTQTIVVGSHSDSVPAGPGINDNGTFPLSLSLSIHAPRSLLLLTGSGSAANLGLAIALARLFRTSTYPKYQYRVRFCWWGAEEVGLLGSDDHVKKANASTVVGDRVQDYLINLNFDMLASPNYIFGIYDGRTARNDTPTKALAGSNKITALFRGWFEQQDLPWDYTDFSGRSDYGPFLAAGVVAGGLFTGADETKTEEQRFRYDQKLVQSSGGVAGKLQDPCYHKACDTLQNIDILAYEKMVQAAAYVLESLGQQPDLRGWLEYPPLPMDKEAMPLRKHDYDPINEYFNLPYL